MTIREFFKITKWKITSTLFIFITLIIFSFPVEINMICKVGVDCPSFIGFIQIYNIPSTFVSINYLFIIFELIISYLISCIIIYIYNRIKKNKKSKK